jgi:hypothetical protein
MKFVLVNHRTPRPQSFWALSGGLTLRTFGMSSLLGRAKVAQIKSGSPVDIRLMDGAATLRGRVDSIARGITDQDNRDGPQLLASVNPTFTHNPSRRDRARSKRRIQLSDARTDGAV